MTPGSLQSSDSFTGEPDSDSFWPLFPQEILQCSRKPVYKSILAAKPLFCWDLSVCVLSWELPWPRGYLAYRARETRAMGCGFLLTGIGLYIDKEWDPANIAIHHSSSSQVSEGSDAWAEVSCFSCSFAVCTSASSDPYLQFTLSLPMPKSEYSLSSSSFPQISWALIKAGISLNIYVVLPTLYAQAPIMVFD